LPASMITVDPPSMHDDQAIVHNCDGVPVNDIMHIYTDGSGGLHTKDKVFRRCVWGFAACIEKPMTRFGDVGTLNIVPRAELDALWGPFRLHHQ
jgi:hypothetical protein